MFSLGLLPLTINLILEPFALLWSIVVPGGTFIAAGTQCEKEQIANIRANILRNPSRLRKVISAPEFVEMFGEPNPHSKGERQNIFGHLDTLKVAPKGVDKNHKWEAELLSRLGCDAC